MLLSYNYLRSERIKIHFCIVAELKYTLDNGYDYRNRDISIMYVNTVGTYILNIGKSGFLGFNTFRQIHLITKKKEV